MNWRIPRALFLTAALTVCALPAPPAVADTVHFKDGRVWTGVVRCVDDESTTMHVVTGPAARLRSAELCDIARIENDGDIWTPGTTRLVFIPLEGGVGTYVHPRPLEEALDATRDLGGDVVAVLVVDAFGGHSQQVLPIAELVHRYEDQLRVVGWVKRADSAAGIAVFGIDELYMTPEGEIGHCSAIHDGICLGGPSVDKQLELGERVSALGGRNPLIMRSMQCNWYDLSADTDDDGVVIWHEGDGGECIVSRKGEILNLDADKALKFGLVAGVAATEDELAALLGLEDWQRSSVGEQIMRRWQQMTRVAERNVPATRARLAQLMAQIRAGDSATRRQAIRNARTYLDDLKRWQKSATPISLQYGIDEAVLREIDRQLREAEAQP